jgi:hypothetical protein
VDAEEIGQRYFFGDNRAGMNWLRDMWNLLMFGKPPNESFILLWHDLTIRLRLF